MLRRAKHRRAANGWADASENPVRLENAEVRAIHAARRRAIEELTERRRFEAQVDLDRMIEVFR